NISHFCHEIGHALGLMHSYNSDIIEIGHFDFLDDVYGTCPEPAMMGGPSPCNCTPPPGYVCYLKASCFLNAFPSGHPFMSGNPEKSTYISPKQAGKMHRNLCLIDNNFAFTKNLHKYVLEEYSAALPYNITADETWDFTIKMYQDIVVKPGATLTITCTVRMPREGKIIVEPGGKLVVDGGTITCAHDGFWQGIEVHGNSSLSQFTNQQGEVLIKNQAVIEHARYAVALWKRNSFSTTGGYVRAYNSTFKNNETDVEALFYSNDYNGNHYANKTFFSNVEFIWNSEFRASIPRPHVALCLVDGIVFTGCTFADFRDPFTFNEQCMGIASLDAKYKVTARCTAPVIGGCSGPIDVPGSEWDPTLFENLYYGIYSSNAFNNYTINVDRCLFRDNGYGVQMVGLLSSVVTRSKFEFTDNPAHFATSSAMHGIHAVNSKMLTIEENEFLDIAPLAPLAHGFGSLGVVCSDLGEQNERVYKNTFSEITYANFTQGKNRSSTTVPKGLTGLEFPCNSNINNRFDHKIKKTLWGVEGPNYGVKKTSGSPSKPVGTTFSADPGNVFTNEDYSNSSHFPVTYWHYTSQTPDDYNTSFVSMFPTSSLPSCPSTLTDYPGGLHKLTPANKAALQSEFENLNAMIADKEAEYATYSLNETETDAILTANANLTPGNKHDFKALLESYSPYLTTEILFAVSAHHPSEFPHPWLKDVLVANIDGVTPELLTYLAEKPHPMPAPFREDVANAVSTVYTSRTVLESEISQLYADRSFAASRIITGEEQDTIDVDEDTLRYWLTRNQGYLYQEEIIDSYLQEKNFTRATEEVKLLNEKLATFPVEIREEVSSFIKLKEWLIPVVKKTGSIAQLKEEELEFLRDIALNGKGTAQYQAQNILCFFYRECTPYPVEDLDPRVAEMNQSTAIVNESMPSVLMVYPNPSSQWMHISLSHNINVENTEIIMTDLSGRVVYQTMMATNSITLNTNSIDNGIYLVNVKQNNKLIGTQKVVIQK
ncbi:MAG TPA: zinc-dependent metalloprotease, partial [Flavobacteriales bacterium]|nr:zinc-dependent metalloprotease [Flavobacteriales bacterium]